MNILLKIRYVYKCIFKNNSNNDVRCSYSIFQNNNGTYQQAEKANFMIFLFDKHFLNAMKKLNIIVKSKKVRTFY